MKVVTLNQNTTLIGCIGVVSEARMSDGTRPLSGGGRLEGWRLERWGMGAGIGCIGVIREAAVVGVGLCSEGGRL